MRVKFKGIPPEQASPSSLAIINHTPLLILTKTLRQKLASLSTVIEWIVKTYGCILSFYTFTNSTRR